MSLNGLGSGYKYNANTLDHDDLIMIEQNLDKLIGNNYKQTKSILLNRKKLTSIIII